MPGSGYLEQPRLFTCLVREHGHAGDCLGTPPEVGVRPILSNSIGSEKYDVGVHLVLAVGHQYRQLTNSRSRAGAFWVGEYDEGWLR